MDAVENLIRLSRSGQYCNRVLAQQIVAGNPRLADECIERGLVHKDHFKYLTSEGEEEGAYCFRDGCNGIMKYEKRGYMADYGDGEGYVSGCSCHTGNPPCGYCTNSWLVCSECGYDIDHSC